MAGWASSSNAKRCQATMGQITIVAIAMMEKTSSTAKAISDRSSEVTVSKTRQPIKADKYSKSGTTRIRWQTFQLLRMVAITYFKRAPVLGLSLAVPACVCVNYSVSNNHRHGNPVSHP